MEHHEIAKLLFESLLDSMHFIEQLEEMIAAKRAMAATLRLTIARLDTEAIYTDRLQLLFQKEESSIFTRMHLN